MIVERLALERRVLASLEAGRIPVVLGGCGTGRTSLLLRVERALGTDHAQYVDFAAAATTPERCLAAVLQASRFTDAPAPAPPTPRAAFDALLRYVDQPSSQGAPVALLIDEVLDVRTFESFPGLRHVQREMVARLAETPTRIVLTSRFTARTHRLLRDAPARFEVIHIPALTAAEVQAMARLFDGGRREWADDAAPAIATLSGGRASYVALLLDALSAMGPAIDPVAALAALFAPGGRLTARCRESYELRLHRARGYGALKAILGVLAQDEPRNLTEIALALHRTPGSTKDYLSWLEDVDLITSRGKRYSFEDPLLRLYVRLYGRPTPPSDDDVVREIGAYAREHLPGAHEFEVPVAASVEAAAGSDRSSGIIEID
ncbi:MAG: hypothetical protein R2752_04145 [Vicinamibacterales bacterium]